MKNLEKMHDEIVSYIKAENINIFPGAPALAEDNTNIVVWEEANDDWKSFIDIAKEAGVKYMIVSKQKGEGEHADEIGSITLAWIKDGIIYLFSKLADWRREEVDTGEESERIHPRIGLALAGEIPKKLLKELKEKNEKDLADELLSFVAKEFPEGLDEISVPELRRLFWQKKGLSYGYVDDPEISIKIRKVDMLAEQKLEQTKYAGILEKSEKELVEEALEFVKKEFGEETPTHRATDLFWESKGIRRYTSDANLRLKIEKVEALVRQKLEQGQLKREKDILQKLVKECLEWASENELRKVTKSNVDYFLTEKGVQLSKTSKDALYNQVNFKLRK
jgi:hypothetical protein